MRAAIRRIITCETEAGESRFARVEPVRPLVGASSTYFGVWGWDEPPVLPVAQLDYTPTSLFAAPGGVRVTVVEFHPPGTPDDRADEERAAGVAEYTRLRLAGDRQRDHDPATGMHRTDTIDLAVVLKGEVDIAYPGEDGQVHTTTAREGDFFVQNGAFHEFHNRSDDPCVILMFVFGAERKEA